MSKLPLPHLSWQLLRHYIHRIGQLSFYQWRQCELSSVLEINNLRKIYGDGENKVIALENVSFSINQGEVVLIVGSSGSRKSTLLNMIGLLGSTTNGKVFIDGNDTTKLNDYKLSAFSNKKLGFILQFSNLLSDLTVLENVLFPIQIAGTNST